MADPSAPTNAGTVGANTDAAARAANAAIATGGSAGLQAYQQAQGQLGAARQAAVSQAAQRASFVGGPEAQNPAFTAPIGAAYNAGAGKLAAGASNLQGLMSGLKSANQDYFNNVRANAPLAIAQALSNAQAKVPQSVKEDSVIGAAQKDFQAAQAGDTSTKNSYNQRISDAQAKADQAQKTMKDAYSQWGKIAQNSANINGQELQPGGVANATKLLAAAHQAEVAYNQANAALSQAKGVAAPTPQAKDVFTYAQQEATKNGYTPDQASALFNSSNKTMADRIVAANPNVQQVDSQMRADIRSGAVKYKDTFDQKIAALAKADPYAADYLARKYESQVTARPTAKSAKAAKVKGG